ncbi:MAG: hypothetical protein MK133_11480, partial [Planctomycetes bacterium]|nr:hypothetical protein [Planctomycetota bacterium]
MDRHPPVALDEIDQRKKRELAAFSDRVPVLLHMVAAGREHQASVRPADEGLARIPDLSPVLLSPALESKSPAVEIFF